MLLITFYGAFARLLNAFIPVKKKHGCLEPIMEKATEKAQNIYWNIC